MNVYAPSGKEDVENLGQKPLSENTNIDLCAKEGRVLQRVSETLHTQFAYPGQQSCCFRSKFLVYSCYFKQHMIVSSYIFVCQDSDWPSSKLTVILPCLFMYKLIQN